MLAESADFPCCGTVDEYSAFLLPESMWQQPRGTYRSISGSYHCSGPGLVFYNPGSVLLVGEKYLTFGNNALVIHLELLWFKRTRYIMLGRRSQIMMRRASSSDPNDHSQTIKPELYVTDSYGQRHSLLHYEPSQKERVVAIWHEICRQYPELTQVQEDWPKA